MAAVLLRSDITAFILAGGQGQRMEGEDKGLILLWGQPLVMYALKLLNGQVNEIMISANRNIDAYRKLGQPVYEDIAGQRWGPLAGMLTAMRHASTSHVLIVPCDCPCLPPDLVERMVDTLNSESADICVAHDGERLQNTVALLPCDLADDLEAYLESGQRKAENWLRAHNMSTANFSGQAEAFQNVNTLAHLQQLEQKGSCA